MARKRKRAGRKFEGLKEIFRTLLGPDGCAWDRRQTHDSLIPYLREEVEEFIAEVERRDYRCMREELGDILLHVMFQAELASRSGRFGIDDVIETLADKLKRRHPHVFGKEKVSSVSHIVANWERIKEREKGRTGGLMTASRNKDKRRPRSRRKRKGS